ncbi:peroxidase [Pseudoalteromonas sp. NBT06-2]|uniref:carboxymuconolactone decarboxylase family protein n=1 Tax=Pseudoalteromonas sp. NBT06-2 TaxID=2025950 RepID=UPI000BA7725D|nr:carboxymuconolactone decarboxylase family protein [Pseudoalteromonas sp. NBT06-2]PAJ75797.1 peroxidase [Pseudoalteromonas sp. NBT06-2]
MPLVNPLASDANEEVIELAKFFNETLGFCPNSVLTMQHRPGIAKAFINLNMAIMANEGRVTAEQKRLIGYITSANTGCRYCEAHTILAAERYGGTEQRLANIWSFRESNLYTEAEKAAFELALAASSVPNAVNDEITAQMHEYWDEGEIVEILAVISLFGYLNRWNDSMSTTMETGAVDAGERLLSESTWTRGKHI